MIRTLPYAVSALAALALSFVFAISPVATAQAQTGNAIELGGGWVYSLPRTQNLRICVHGIPLRPQPTQIVVHFHIVHNTGDPVLAGRLDGELGVPDRGFQCVDILYEALTKPGGLEPDPTTGAVSFLLEISQSSTVDDANQGLPAVITNGLITNSLVTTATGAIKLYQPIVLGRLFNGAASQPPTE